MANISRTILSVILLLLSVLSTSNCATPKKVTPPARKEDIPFIKCQVCELLAREIYKQVQQWGVDNAPAKIKEIDIIGITERVCDLKKRDADWILTIDIVEKGDALELVEQDAEGYCNSECKTIAQACQQVMGYLDTDISEYIFTKKPSVDSLVTHFCHDLSEACSTKPPSVPKDRIPGEPFVAKPTKEAEMDKIMRSMAALPGGPNMKLYSRDELKEMNSKDNKAKDEEDEDEDGDDDEEDDDEDDKFASNLREVWRKKDSSSLDIKQRVIRGIKETGNTLKGHVNNVSSIVKKWWKGGKRSERTKKDKSEL